MLQDLHLWALTDSNRRPSACKADALNQLSQTPLLFVSGCKGTNIFCIHQTFSQLFSFFLQKSCFYYLFCLFSPFKSQIRHLFIVAYKPLLFPVI